MTYNSLQQPESITWDFTVTEQGHSARYGRLGRYYFKQFLPGGLDLSDAHPPKAIPALHYKLAEAERNRKAAQTGNI